MNLSDTGSDDAEENVDIKQDPLDELVVKKEPGHDHLVSKDYKYP